MVLPGGRGLQPGGRGVAWGLCRKTHRHSAGVLPLSGGGGGRRQQTARFRGRAGFNARLRPPRLSPEAGAARPASLLAPGFERRSVAS